VRHRHNTTTCVWVDGAHYEYTHAPRNFWSWCEKSQLHYVLRRWPDATAFHNATPFGVPYRRLVWISAAQKHNFKRRKKTKKTI
jgi:hypothetical protein